MKSRIFVLVLLLPNLGLSQLSIGEVFDFNEGDQFHVESTENFGTPSGYIKTLLSKSVSLNEDSIYYAWEKIAYTSVWNEKTEKLEWRESEADTLYESYTHLDSSVYMLHFEQLLKAYEDSAIFLNKEHHPDSLSFFGLLGDTVTQQLSSFCGYMGSAYEVTHGPLGFEPNYEKRIYGKGLGLLHFQKQDGAGGQNGASGWEVVYFKKAGEDCGQKTYNSLKARVLKTASAYPNPFVQHFTVSVYGSFDEISLRLFDASGKLVQQAAKFKSSNPKFIMKDLPANGFYFYELRTNGEVLQGKVLKLGR